MRAILVKDGKGPVENLYLGETETPPPQPGQVLVKIKAFGLNRMDITQREGRYPPPKGSSEILGVEFSGMVHQLGEGVDKWKEGDEVIGLVGGGAYAEFIACHSTHLMRKPHHLSWTEAAAIPETYLTAYQALVLIAGIQKDEDVLIHAGASGVGISAIQLARLFGARTVTTTASSQEKLDWLLGHGATHAANYKTEDFSEVVKKATNGSGAHIIVDMVGQSHWNKNLSAIGLDGRLVILAFMSGNVVESADISPILFKRLRIQGTTLRSRSLEYQANLISSFEKDALHHIVSEKGEGLLKVYLHQVFPWQEIQDAHREMEANKNIGKIVVEVV